MKIIVDAHEELTLHVPESAVTEYLRTLLWTETTGEDLEYEGEEVREGTPLDDLIDVSDLPTSIVIEARELLESVQHQVWEATQVDPFAEGAFEDLSRAIAEDVCLTQNRHGAGFWDHLITHDGSETVGWNPVDGETDHPAYRRDMTWAAYLTEVAHELGTFGLSVWVDETTGKLKVESHS